MASWMNENNGESRSRSRGYDSKMAEEMAKKCNREMNKRLRMIHADEGIDYGPDVDDKTLAERHAVAVKIRRLRVKAVLGAIRRSRWVERNVGFLSLDIQGHKRLLDGGRFGRDLWHGVWGFASVLYVVLALNRFVVIIGWVRVTHYVTRVPIYVWLFLAASWSFYTGILHKPLTYNSKAFLAFYIPFIEDPSIELGKYENRMHALNNVLFSVLICFFYSVISLILLVGTHRKQISKKEINALIQAVLITCPAMIGSLLYVYIQFTNKATKGWAILGQFMWQTITGTGAIIYLTLNQSVRDYYFHRSRVHGYQTTTSDSNQGKLQPAEQTGIQKC
ncbi:unnamed protein product, partial [Mesorhabditis belari]|uniref:Uncharacterized protein n=1 Tax=Mesorhabditis belari TaxID=2138241 RepID=A0AAF3ELX9_9BILA